MGRSSLEPPLSSIKYEPQRLPASFDAVRDFPLVIDLDGTLVLRDTLMDLFLDMGKRCPWNFLKIPYWYALGGRSYVKHQLTRYLQVNPDTLVFHTALVEALILEKKKGRVLILATGANEKIAEDIARHISVFTVILGSTISKNLTGKNKADQLVTLYGERGFLYAGNAKIDRYVWERSAGIIVVNPDSGVSEMAHKIAKTHGIPIYLFEEQS